MSDPQNVPVTSVPHDARILDVREDNEWEAGHIEGALHIPLGELPDRFEELDPDQELHVICRSGGRSQRAAEWLEGHGYTAINISGGSAAWLEAGKPMVSATGAEPTVL